MTHTSVDHHAATGERSVDEGARRDLYDAEDGVEGNCVYTCRSRWFVKTQFAEVCAKA